ncbi:galactose-binding domain-like protein [Umbelopsis sp. PMI_123]|nr:galactose-binding domain-like protein [Umbelopsis sp. PMI_123]
MSIKHIHNAAQFRELLSSAPATKLVVVDFTASWCAPCQTIAPFFTNLSQKYRHVTFAKVDVDQVKDVASERGVTSMPTFQFYQGGNKIAELKGANPKGLEDLVRQHQGDPNQDPVSSVGVSGHSDLKEFITLNQIDIRNEQEEHNVRNIFNDSESYLESDVDEQLMIGIPFNQTVRIHSLKIKAPSPSHGPKTIKLYANKQNMDFDDADSVQETQTLQLSESDLDGKAIINLRFVKFQNISSIVLFVIDNQGDEETTQIQQLTFIGSPVETTKMGDLKKAGDDEH